MVPWASDPTAQVIHDAFHKDGTPFEIAPRNVLKRIVKLYADHGMKPVVAPEMEFYLVKPNIDPDYPLEPPVGRSGRPERARQAYSITAVNEFEELFDDIYRFSEAQGLEIDTLNHEDGTAQMEINLRHGDPVELADQVFLFKRTIREAALRHKMYATFMAKPIATEPGSAMHIHHSVIEPGDRPATSSPTQGGELAPAFLCYIAGMQTYLPRVMCMLAPYVNSYRRLIRNTSAPINVRWGYDNRTVGLRVPLSDPENRRVENRVPSSDANPYLAIAASLACGYLGLVNKLEPDRPIEGASHDPNFALPRSILDAVRLLENTPELVDIFGESLRAHLPGDQGDGIRDLHGRDQPVGARISAAERLGHFREWRARFRRPSIGSPSATCPNIPRSTARAGPTSASSAAASPAFRRRSISPKPAPTSCSSRRTRSRAARRDATAGRSIPGSGSDQLWLEKRFGFEKAKVLWDLAEEAKALVRALIVRFAIPCDLRAGVIEALHKPSLLPEAASAGGGAVQPLPLRPRHAARPGRDGRRRSARSVSPAPCSTAAAAISTPTASRSASPAPPPGSAPRSTNARRRVSLGRDGRPVVRTARGDITADHVIVATEGRSGSFEQITRRRMVGINSFIVATEPLGAEGDAILPGGESAADSRFVVRYWRKSPDGRLIFGGGESNAGRIPADVQRLRAPASRRDLSAACRRPDRAWLGRHRLGHRAAPALSCARSRPPSGRPAAIRARASRSPRSSASCWPRRRSAGPSASRRLHRDSHPGFAASPPGSAAC